MTAVDALRAPSSPQPDLCVALGASVDVARIGEKAHALGRLIRAGLAIPQGFVIGVGGLDAHLDGRVVAPADADADAAAVRAIVEDSRLPSRIHDQVLALALPLLVNGPVVVRSSAVGEDGVGQSFAGQLDSILHVSDMAALERAIRTCWASYWSDRVVFYRCARDVESRGMGVIVQRQVAAVAAGILFTSTTEGEMLVEYGVGLADALVAGAIDPGRLTIDRRAGTVRHLAIARAESGAEFRLDARHVEQLRTIGHAVEREFHAPQDVEWAIDAAGTLYVVQSRPITAPVTIGALMAVDPPRTSRRRISWSNANVNENFPAPISPLLYSIASVGYSHYFRNLARAFGVSAWRIRAMEPSLEQIVGVHGARMYYNLTAIHSVLRLAPFGAALTVSFDSFVGADGSEVDAQTARSPSRLRQSLEVARILVRACASFTRLDRRVARFEARIYDFARRTAPDRLDQMMQAQRASALAEFMDIRGHRWLDASLADAASMLCYGALERLLKYAHRGQTRATTSASLLKAIPGVVSGEPVFALWELSRLVRASEPLRALMEDGTPAAVIDAIHTDERFVQFRAAFVDYLDRWGFRCSEELMLTSPTFQDNPEPLIDLLRAYARVDGPSPADAIRSQARERELETERVRRDIGFLEACALGVLLPWTHAAVRLRERARLAQALLYSRCRRIALSLGDALAANGTLSHRDDVFFLSVTELIELARGGAMLPAAIASTVVARRAEHARLSRVTPPDAFTLAEGEYFDASLPVRDVAPVSTDDRLSGIGACGGRVSGRAVVLGSVTESERLAGGDILVTKQTDPGWGPVFFLIAGLVIERGGMLSHGAIIAREFGIPCVVGVRDAMRRIPAHAMITVDGDRGEVHVAE